MSKVTCSCEDNYGYQAMNKFRECGIESSKHEKDSRVFSSKSRKDKWKSQPLKTEIDPT